MELDQDKQKILNLLEKVFLQNPTQRFCQFMLNITHKMAQSKISKDMYYISDKEFIDLLEKESWYLDEEANKTLYQVLNSHKFLEDMTQENERIEDWLKRIIRLPENESDNI